jgi:hypothetical protein
MSYLVASPDTFILCDSREDAEAQKLLFEPEEQMSTLILDMEG